MNPDDPQPNAPTVAITPGPTLRAQRGAASATPTNVAPTASRLGHYPVQGVLGAGGMGQVLEVTDPSLGRTIAAKVIKGTADSAARAKFAQEARVTGQLEHPNIIPVYELSDDGEGPLYYTMKRVRGESLEALMRRRGAPGGPSLSGLLSVFVKVCDAIEYAHARNVIHRDLKPANVMVGQFGEVLVVDWGLAKRMKDAGDATEEPLDATARAGAHAAGETLDGEIMGTPNYMPPEQATGQIGKLDQRSDIYSLGTILYEMLAGARAYDGPTPWVVLEEVIAGRLIAPSARAPEAAIPWELEAVVLKAMAHRRGARYGTVAELRADLVAYLEGRVLSAARYSPVQLALKWAVRHRHAMAACAAVLACVLGLAGLARWRAHKALGTQLELAQTAVRDGQSHAALAAYEQALNLAPDCEEARAGRRAIVLERARAATAQLAAVGPLREAWEALAARRARGEPDRLPSSAEQRARATEVDRALAAVTELERGLELEPSEPELAALRRRSGETLGWLALLGGDHAFAAHAFAALARHGLPEAESRALADRVEVDRTQRLALWAARTTGAIEDVRAGLGRPDRPNGAPLLEDYLFELTAYRDASVAAVLASGLERHILAVAKSRGEGPGREGWSQSEQDLARLILGALGRLALAESVPPLAAAIEQLEAPELVVEAGVALCNTRRPEANAPLLAARDRFGINSIPWRQIKRYLARVPPATGDGEPASAKDLNARGLVRLQKREFEGALADFTEALRLTPHMTEAWVNCGNVRRNQGDLDGAIADYGRAIALDPTFVYAYNNRGMVRAEKGDADGALADYGHALRLQPRYTQSLTNRGNLRRNLGDLEGAIRDFDRALEIEARFADAFQGRGNARADQGDLEGALADYNRALELDPGDPQALNGRGAVRHIQGDLDGAIADYDLAIRQNPGHALSFANRGTARYAKGDVDGALRDYDVALGLDPRYSRGYSQRGVIRHAKGDLDSAIADYDRAIELDARNAEAHYRRGNARKAKGDRDGAIADYDRTIQLDAKHASAHYNRGNARREQGKLDEAIADYDRVIQLDPKYASAYNARGQSRKERGDAPGAIADFDRAIELDPNHAGAHLNRANARKDQGKLDEAIADYSRAVELDPTFAAAYHNRGNARREQGKLDDAIADYDRTISLSPSHWKAWMNRGLALSAAGRRALALESIARASELAPATAASQLATARTRIEAGR